MGRPISLQNEVTLTSKANMTLSGVHFDITDLGTNEPVDIDFVFSGRRIGIEQEDI
jgi:hypothetical protein